MDEPSAAIVDESGCISEALLCLECRYDLRTLPVSGACPECGTPVRVSMRADGLAEADPAYRQTLVQSARWMLGGTMATLVLGYIGVALAAVGIWGLTRREPGRTEPKYDSRLRQLSRLGIGLGAGGMLLCFLIGLAILIWSPRLWITFGQWQPVDVILVSLHGAMFLGFMALWEYISILGRRMKDRELVGRCRRIRWVWVIALTMICSLALGTSLANWLLASRWVSQAWAWNDVGAAIPLVIMVMVLLWIWLESVFFCRLLRRKLGACVTEHAKVSSQDQEAGRV